MSKDFWDAWSGGDFEPIPAGNYAVELTGVEVKEGFNGDNKTELTLRLCADQPRAGKLLWLDWPMEGPNVEKLGWLARMAYETLVGPGRPAGESPEAALRSMVDALRANIGKAVTATVSIREYTTRDGEQRRVNNVKRLTAFQPTIAPPAGGYQGGQHSQRDINNGLAGLRDYAAQNPNPNPAGQPSPYGGEGYAAAQQAQQGQNGGRPW